MRVVVTGGAGYIGSVVVEVLLEEGHDVLGRQPVERAPGRHCPTRCVRADRAGRWQSSRRDPAAVWMRSGHPYGGGFTRRRVGRESGQVLPEQRRLWIVLLDAMREAGVPRLVFSSTAAVYGEPSKQPIHETDPTDPTNPYGETKLAFERVLCWYAGAVPGSAR